jgi:rod shape-determining protein MreD
MSRIAGSSSEVAIRDFRFRHVPMLSTVAAILLALLPFVVSTPIIPDLGFLALITWRLLRPEIWPAQVALGFGLFADLVSGHPLGQSMLLWTLVFLLFDLVDSRLGFRDYLMDWLLAAAAILLHGAGVWYIALLMGSDINFLVMLPQIGVSVLAYPLVARVVLGLDRWRLKR